MYCVQYNNVNEPSLSDIQVLTSLLHNIYPQNYIYLSGRCQIALWQVCPQNFSLVKAGHGTYSR